MTKIEMLKRVTRLINHDSLTEKDKAELKDILCYLSEWRKNFPEESKAIPQLEFVLYNASMKLRTFGYNRLNKFTCENINGKDNTAILKDYAVDELYKTKSGFILDKAQKEVLDAFEENGRKLFLSAPTSFGKTFLLKEIIYRHYEEYKNIVIVLPTVALLMEVTEELEQFNSKVSLGFTLYNSVYKDIHISDRNIFVLTPERVLRLLAIMPDIKLDFFFFDEIYKIDEDVSMKSEDDDNDIMQVNRENNQSNRSEHRAVAFRLALYFLLKRCLACYLAGPFISLENLCSGFKKMLQRHGIYPIEITFSPTLKNEIDFHGGKYIHKSVFGKEEEKTTASTAIDRLVYVAQKLNISTTNQAIVYCLYPAYTEKNAREFADRTNEPINESAEIVHFLEHLKRNYSFKYGDNNSFDNWDFVYAMKRGIGIHNGKFPKYFQREIMQMFNCRSMSVLFCTSTIVEGVNTNAKTVVIFNNPSGKTDEGKKFLLLNINGRAGRYQHHFVGNVVYLNKKSIDLIQCGSIALNFKLYDDTLMLQDLDLENIDEDDLSSANIERKRGMSFDGELLPDSVFAENRLIERKKQEKVLNLILERISEFIGIDHASIKLFTEKYFECILNIWAEVGEINYTQVNAIKYFSINYANNSYVGVLQYEFDRYETDENSDAHKFANETYRKVFRNVKDTVEYQLPRIISLFETLINRAFEIKGIQLEAQIDLSYIIRFFEVGAASFLGTDMIEKGVPVIAVRKVEKMHLSGEQLVEQKEQFKEVYRSRQNLFDEYEKNKIESYIRKFC